MNDSFDKIKKRRRLRKSVVIVVSVLVLICLSVIGCLLTLWRNGDRLNRDTMFQPAQRQGALPSGETVSEDAPNEIEPDLVYDGKRYIRNEDLLTILFIGVDTDNANQYAELGVTAHQADMLILGVIDPEKASLRIINIPRMTITEVRQTDARYNYARTTKSPICIQYAFGDGKALSCNLTRDAVSNLLYGVQIDRYVAMNLDGLFAANDALGGVTVTLLEDMTAFNPEMQKGVTYTLLGENAEIYVARRLGGGLDGTNMSRLQRQIQYYKAFFSAVKEKLKHEPMFAIELYNSLGESMQTDLTLDEMIYLSKSAVNMSINDDAISTLEGTVKNEDFFADDAALRERMIQTFYLRADD